MDIINPMCKECTHLNDIEPYVCITCKNGSHFNNRTELKPCPFCGGKAQMNYDGERKLILCSECLIRTESYKTYEAARDVWNRRAENG